MTRIVPNSHVRARRRRRKEDLPAPERVYEAVLHGQRVPVKRYATPSRVVTDEGEETEAGARERRRVAVDPDTIGSTGALASSWGRVR